MLSNGTSINWVGVDTTSPETWSSLKFSADIDCLAFVSLWEIGLITGSTNIWTAAHCIEKYCKSLLILNNPSINLKSYGHNIKKAWGDCKQYLSLAGNNTILDDLIDELNAVQPSVRYGQNSIAVSSGLPAIVNITGAILRKQIVGNTEYSKNYGLSPSLFLPRLGTKEIEQELKILKVLHLLFDHGITFSSMSIPDPLDFIGIQLNIEDLGNNTTFQSCPWCNGYHHIGTVATLELRKFLESADK